MSCTSVCKPSPRRERVLSLALRLPLALALLLGACETRSAGSAEQAAPLKIEVPAEDLDAEVFVDGNYVGQIKALAVPETGPLLLAPGVHRVEVRKPGRFPVQRTVTVERTQQTPVVVRAELLEDPS